MNLAVRDRHPYRKALEDADGAALEERRPVGHEGAEEHLRRARAAQRHQVHLAAAQRGGGTAETLQRDLGHAVGLELDEWPPLQRGTDAILQSGMVLAVEPKLIFVGRGAIGIEDTYLVTDGGLSPITFSTRDIVVV